MQKRSLYYLIALSVILVSCEGILDPPEDKLPAKLDFSFGMNTHVVETDKQDQTAFAHNQSQGFSLTQGQIILENISFDGRRGEGRKDVFFTSDFSQPYHIQLGETPHIPGIAFDIPQGVYPMVEVTLHLGNGELPAIVMEGMFQRGVSQPVAVRYEYNHREQVRIRANAGQANQQIVFSKEEPLRATIVLHTESLLRLINLGLIMQAQTVMINGEEVLLINEQTNPSIYNSMSARLQQAFSLDIE